MSQNCYYIEYFSNIRPHLTSHGATFSFERKNGASLRDARLAKSSTIIGIIVIVNATMGKMKNLAIYFVGIVRCIRPFGPGKCRY
jgi:hypothetical protein